MDGLVGSTDLDDDMVGPSIAGTKLRSNIYRTENGDWQEIQVRYFGKYTTHVSYYTLQGICNINLITFPLILGDNRERCSGFPVRYSGSKATRERTFTYFRPCYVSINSRRYC